MPSYVPFSVGRYGSERSRPLSQTTSSFDDQFARLFDAHYGRLFRYLNRLSGEPELAADVLQEAFMRLYRRGSVPDEPGAWLVSVAMNLIRNEKTTRSRRLRLLTPERGEQTVADPPPSPDQSTIADEEGVRVRRALDRLEARERQMLLLCAEGYRYREIAVALKLNEASVGVMLARARRAFRQAYGETADAP